MTLTCRHFNTCGGCIELTTDHATQRRSRESEVLAALAAHLPTSPLAWTDTPTQAPRHDRLRILYPVQPVPSAISPVSSISPVSPVSPSPPSPTPTLRTGLYRRGTHDLVEITACEIQHPTLTELGRRAQRVFERRKLTAYDEHSRRGDLRAFSARMSASTGELLLGVVATRADLPDARGLARDLQHAADGLGAGRGKPVEVVGVVLNVNAEPGNALLGARTITLSGRDHIFDKVDGLRFRISFGSFYQLHRRAQALLYAPAMAMLTGGDGDLRGQTVIDGYGGIGTFGLRCSRRHAEVVHIVEANPEAVADARHNAAQVTGRVEVHHTPFAAVDLPTPDLLIVDPNRAGLRAEGRARVLALGPPRILYVACGLEALARDLDGLPGYRVRDLRLADLFPHTGHVEVLALLERL